MGEYAKVIGSGSEIKMGTCENMYWMRWSQRRQVWPQANSLNPADPKLAGVLRFRFPWPDEDDMSLEDMQHCDPFRSLPVRIPVPDGVDHSTVQFRAEYLGYLLSIPCPESDRRVYAEDEHGDPQQVRVGRNAFRGEQFLVGQAWRGGRLVPIMRCVCGAAFHLPTIVDAEPVIRYLLEHGLRLADDENVDSAEFYKDVAQRIRVPFASDDEESPDADDE